MNNPKYEVLATSPSKQEASYAFGRLQAKIPITSDPWETSRERARLKIKKIGSNYAVVRMPKQAANGVPNPATPGHLRPVKVK